MVRRSALAVSFILVGAVPALAQTHPRPHDKGHPHGPGHVRPDSAEHSALHALLHGSWTGTLRSPQGVSSGLDLSVVYDSLRIATVQLRADKSIRVGGASHFTVTGDKLQWTQDVAGASCKATAVLNAATTLVAGVMEGKVACEDGESTFTLRRKTG